jgi:integration host factor subunit alpha
MNPTRPALTLPGTLISVAFQIDRLIRPLRAGGAARSGKTVTRADLSEAVYQKVGLSRTESSALVERVLAEICASLSKGETVKLSSFGSFVVRDKGQRVGRNPKTGIEVPIEPRRVMVFKPSNVLKGRINGLNGAGEGE